MDLISYFADHWITISELTWEHIYLIFIAMVISITLGVLIGIAITYHQGAAKIVLNIAGVLMTIPSLALFALLIPLLHIGSAPAIAGLVLYTQLPIVRNVYVGIININPAIIEAARGMGMSALKIMFKIKLPLAYPVIMAGIRTAVVMGIGIGAIASYIGAGGLGDLVFHGISRTNDKMVLAGAIMISLLSIVSDRLLLNLEKRAEIYKG